VSFVFGAYLLFNTPEMEVPWATIISLALATGAFFAFAIGKALAAQRRRPTTGMEGMIGAVGEARQGLTPAGMVLVHGELWRAEAEGEPIAAGERVIVTAQEGFRLRVKKM
jgi:membrane-bound serine protease (ClpP class)